MIRWWLAVLVAAGCAQPQSGRNNTTGTTGGRPDLSTAGAVDLAGVDLANVEPDLAGVDLAGVDLRHATGDLSLGACDWVAQTGCMTPSEKCSYTNLGGLCLANGTVDIDGLCGKSMMPASTADQCKAGLVCIERGPMGGTTVAFCIDYCNLDVDCAQPTFAGGLPPKCESSSLPFKTCTVSCKPFGAADGTNGCSAGTSCHYEWDVTAMTEQTDCFPFGAVAEGGDCKMAACAPGMTCVGPDANNVRCRRICESSGNCVSGQLCDTPYNGATIKVCFQP